MSASDPMLPDFGPGIRVTPGARLSESTTFRLGGPCRARIDCDTGAALIEAVARLRDAGMPFALIGGGSNLLVSDEGLAGAVVRFVNEQAQPAREGRDVSAGAETGLDALALFCAREGLDGLRFATGIPGTVGGAIAGNAGAFGEDIASRISSLTVLDPDGKAREVAADRHRFSYRRSDIGERGAIVLRAKFRLSPASAGVLLSERERILACRAERHPDWRRVPTAGSFFRNIEPTSAAGRRQAAGWFLEQAGAKAMREGGARVYEKHANIVVADGPGCTARDVIELTRRMAGAVRRLFDIDLTPEVRRLGPAAS